MGQDLDNKKCPRTFLFLEEFTDALLFPNVKNSAKQNKNTSFLIYVPYTYASIFYVHIIRTDPGYKY